jgi:hypothetical protein
MNLVAPLQHATAAAVSTTGTTFPLLVPTADAAIPRTEPEQEERLHWEKQRGRRRRSNLGFAGWSPRLMKMERGKREWMV